MRTDLTRISATTPLTEALAHMLEADAGCLMVVTGDKLLGIVTERDLLRALAERWDKRS